MKLSFVEQKELGALKVQGLQLNAGDLKLSGSFEVAMSERVALVGESGAGKTSVLRALAGFQEAKFEQCLLGTQSLSILSPAQRQIGYASQEAVMLPALKVWENVAYGLLLRGVSREDALRQVMPHLEKVELAARAMDTVQGLSGGERQRVSFLRAVVWKPALVLLDEPFSALDQRLRSKMVQLWMEYQKEWPAPALWVSHDSDEVHAGSTRQIQLRNHQIHS